MATLLQILILAAGKGTRMHLAHQGAAPAAGKPLGHVVDTAHALGAAGVQVWFMVSAAMPAGDNLTFALQAEQLHLPRNRRCRIWRTRAVIAFMR